MPSKATVKPKARWFVTFGQKYWHDDHPTLGKVLYLPDKVWWVEADTYAEARHTVIRALGVEWAWMYPASDFERQVEDWGYRSLNLAADGRVQSLAEWKAAQP